MQLEPELLQQVLQTVNRPFWHDGGFWVSIVVGILGLAFSVLAWSEAKGAKAAATEAGRSVKLQTTAIELSEIAQKLERIQPEVRYSEARDLLSEVSRRARRSTSPFAKDETLKDAISALLVALSEARQSLKDVRPTDIESENEAPNSVYFAVEGHFTNIGDCVADLLGLFEKVSFDFGDEDRED